VSHGLQADILEHRQEQIKAEETKLRTMQQNIEKMDADIARYMEDIARLNEQNRVNSTKLQESANLLKDRDTLEDAVRKQHDLIEKQTEELKALKKQLEERDASLDKAK
jgi:DNA repair exonuclease SbcCD ATPase subunit